MGGSLGLAVRRRGGWSVRGLVRRKETIRDARRRGVLDEGFLDPAPALQGADVIVLCVPVDRILPMAKALRPYMKPGALVMDIGSVKEPIVRGARGLFAGATGLTFIGAHPMAGSEKTGVEFSRADLYEGAVCALTPAPGTAPAQIARAERFWRGVGAQTLCLSPGDHDRAVALVSHLPHLVADAFMLSVERWATSPAQRTLIKRLAAGSFRDATRVAGADPALWHGIFSLNDRPVRGALTLFQQELARLARGRWRVKDLDRAQSIHQKFRKDSNQ